MSSLDADKNGTISCDELISHFMNIKKDYGMEKMAEHLKLFEDAVKAYKPAEATSEKEMQTSKKNLPSTWMPIMMARIGAIYKRIDMNGDNSIDKAEILALAE